MALLHLLREAPARRRYAISIMGAATEAWNYRYIDGAGQNVTMVFENSRGDGEYRLANAPMPKFK